MNCNRNFKWPLMQRWQCLIYNGTLETFIWSMIWKICFLGLKWFNSDISYIYTTSKNCQFSKLITLITNSYLIRQSFEGYRCESDFTTFAWSEGHFTFSSTNCPLCCCFKKIISLQLFNIHDKKNVFFSESCIIKMFRNVYRRAWDRIG